MNSKYAGIVFLLGILFTYGQKPEGTPKAIISGKVIDQETSQPLEYATITLTNNKRPDFIQGGITDAKGNFKI